MEAQFVGQAVAVASFSLGAEADPLEIHLWVEAVAAEAEEGFGGGGPERQQTAGLAEGKEGEPGLEH